MSFGARSKNALLSRTVWAAAVGTVLAGLNAAGYHVLSIPADQIADLILFILTGVFRITATKEITVLPKAGGLS